MSVKHVVLFKFKEGTSEEKIAELIGQYNGLPEKIRVMKHFEWGPDMSIEGLQDGYTHCFITTFDDVAGRDEYVPHPEHQAYVEVLLPHLEKVLALDFVPQD
jgi:stress responsive alpha/beta barrel protein